MASVYDYCASCTYLSTDADYDGKYYCEEKGERVPACDAKCRNYCEAYSRSRSCMENMYNNSVDHQSSGCYITTMMCEIINFDDDCYYLKKLREFRDNVMQKNIKDLPLLATYDVYGPAIANKLKEENNYDLAFTLFQKYIVPAVINIEAGKYEEAKKTYIALTESLAERYNINMSTIDANSIKGINPNELGHGKVKIRKPETV